MCIYNEHDIHAHGQAYYIIHLYIHVFADDIVTSRLECVYDNDDTAAKRARLKFYYYTRTRTRSHVMYVYSALTRTVTCIRV